MNPCLQYCISSLTAALFWCGDFHFLINLIFDVFDPYLYYYIPFINCSTLWCHRLWRRKICYWNWMVLLELQKSLSRGIFRPFAPLTETFFFLKSSRSTACHLRRDAKRVPVYRRLIQKQIPMSRTLMDTWCTINREFSRRAMERLLLRAYEKYMVTPTNFPICSYFSF